MEKSASSYSSVKEAADEDDIMLAAELLVQLSEEHSNNNSNNNGGGGGGETADEKGANKALQVISCSSSVAISRVDVAKRRRKRPRFGSLVEIYARTKPLTKSGVVVFKKRKRC